MADFVGALVDMGFPKDRAEKAVSATDGRGVEPAMEWLFANDADTAVVDEKETTKVSSSGVESQGEGSTETPATATDDKSAVNADVTVRSYKCEDCGRVLNNEAEMEFHAAKTSHSNFSESNEEKRPLTEEEKAEQMKRIEEKLKIKRAEREEREKQEAIAKEKLRMRQGKDVGEAKRRFEEQEMKEIAEARRKEKLDDQRARERVRAQIEADKEARRAKAAGEQAAKDGTAGTSSSVSPSTTSVAPPPATLAEPSSSPPVKKIYTTTKLQMRLPSGKALVQSFGVQEPLASVRLYVELNRDDGVTTPFNLMTSHPRKTFEGEDYDIPLEAHGLVPSGVLIVTKSL